MHAIVSVMQATVDNVVRENEELKEEVSRLKAELARLNEQLAWLQRQIFGQKSERFCDLPGLVLEEPTEPEPEQVEVPTHTRRKRRRNGECTLQFPDSLEREQRVIDVPEAERTLPDGRPMVRAGEDRSLKLAYRPDQ